MKTVKVAVIGLGKMGLLHASILNTMPNVEIVALCDKSFVLRKLVKKLFKTTRVINDVKKLAGLDVNSVYVTTPISGHFPIVKSLLSEHVARNIFVEKTLSSSWDKSRQLCELARAFGGVNMVGYMKRFAVTFLKAKSIMANDVLGELISFDAYAFSSDFSKFQSGSRKPALRGGVLSDLGSHVIDLALWLIGDFKLETASFKSIIDSEGEDSVDFKVTKHGLEGMFHVSWCMEDYRMPSFGLSIAGNAGTMKVDDYSIDLKLRSGDCYSWLKHDLDDHVGFFLGESEYYREDEAFINSVLSGVKVEPSFATASKVDFIIDQVRDKVKANVT
jgi:scyllo-inositol 2-dehydrogenase (NADP+)